MMRPLHPMEWRCGVDERNAALLSHHHPMMAERYQPRVMSTPAGSRARTSGSAVRTWHYAGGRALAMTSAPRSTNGPQSDGMWVTVDS